MNNKNILLLTSIALTLGSQVFGMEENRWNNYDQNEQEKNVEEESRCPYCERLIRGRYYGEHVEMCREKYFPEDRNPAYTPPSTTENNMNCLPPCDIVHLNNPKVQVGSVEQKGTENQNPPEDWGLLFINRERVAITEPNNSNEKTIDQKQSFLVETLEERSNTYKPRKKRHPSERHYTNCDYDYYKKTDKDGKETWTCPSHPEKPFSKKKTFTEHVRNSTTCKNSLKKLAPGFKRKKYHSHFDYDKYKEVDKKTGETIWRCPHHPEKIYTIKKSFYDHIKRKKCELAKKNAPEKAEPLNIARNFLLPEENQVTQNPTIPPTGDEQASTSGTKRGRPEQIDRAPDSNKKRKLNIEDLKTFGSDQSKEQDATGK